MVGLAGRTLQVVDESLSVHNKVYIKVVDKPVNTPEFYDCLAAKVHTVSAHGGRVMIHVHTKGQARDIAAAINDPSSVLYVPPVQPGTPAAAALHGETRPSDRIAALDAYRRNVTRILVGTILAEGFDFKTVRRLTVARLRAPASSRERIRAAHTCSPFELPQCGLTCAFQHPSNYLFPAY